MMKYSLLFVLFILTPNIYAAELTAREIVEQVNNRDDGDNQTADMTMILIDKHGKKRVRKISTMNKDKGEDKQRIMFFRSPADVLDTGFLTYDYDIEGKDDDQWLYLPALHKSKRIASSDKSGSFMGSDFNYSDMTRPDLDKYNFKLLKEGKVRGSKVWVIESKPKTKDEAEESGYKKSILFVRQDNFVLVRAARWTTEGGRIKYQDTPGLEKIDGIWTVTKMTMTTKKGKRVLHKTLLNFDNIKYNQPLTEQHFTIRQLEKGFSR